MTSFHADSDFKFSVEFEVALFIFAIFVYYFILRSYKPMRNARLQTMFLNDSLIIK